MNALAPERLSDIRKRVQDRIGASRYRTWFGDSTEFQLREEGLDVVVANSFVGSWIASNYMDELLAATRDVLGDDERPDVRIVQRSAATPPVPRVAVPAMPLDLEAPLLPRRPRADQAGMLRHDLESFVVGPSNRIAHAAAANLARAPGHAYKLLVMHGGCGLGKTHLLQGICNGVRALHPTLEWRYISGEEFTNEFIFAVKAGRVDAFRARFRRVDVLVVDDIHFLANKKATQEEFLHTFNAVESQGKAIVLSSDCHPRAIATLSEPLINRLISGMVVQIDPPEFETRREILRRRAERLDQSVPEEVLDYLARLISNNVRELEGALYTLVALASLSKDPITIDLAKRALDHTVIRTRRSPELADILRIVGQRFAVTTEQINSRSRDRTVTLSRALAMFLIRRHTPMSFPEIGRACGKKNHSTVLMATQRIERQLRGDATVTWKTAAGSHEAPLRGLIEALEQELFPQPK